MSQRTTNWAGNIVFAAQRVHRPASVAELQEVVARADRARVLGSGHSFNRMADTTGDLISLSALPRVVEIDADRRTVRVDGGIRYGDLVAALDAAGLALHNLASLPHISVAGAVATATHGSGERNGNLATAVAAVELVRADGEQVVLRRGEPGFAGAVVGLGALGVITALTLDVVPSFEIRQYVYDDLSRDALGEHLPDILGAGYSVSLFTDWTGPVTYQAWVKRRTDEPSAPPSWLGATLADGPRHPVPGMPTTHCTEQLGRPGPWHLRLPHFRLEFTPSSGEELQSEYFVPAERGAEALAAVDAVRDRVAPVLQISEVRTIAADDLWMSPAHGRDSLAVHFTWIADTAAVTPVVEAVEERLVPLGARPHWGKVFHLAPSAVGPLYPRRDEFVALARRYDPKGKFRNELLDRYLGRS
ncbi:MAG TPA: FAD-binding protein [Actinoplanes sp.]|nr:FAD-binding protein [Actinoplanes sp.]